MPLAWLLVGFWSLPPLPTNKLGPSGADSYVGGFVYILGPCGLSNDLSCEVGSFSHRCNSIGFYLQRFCLQRFYFPVLEPWVEWSALLPSCSSQFICTWIWDCPSISRRLALHPFHPGWQSPPLLPVWVNVSSLTPWLSDSHTVQFSEGSGYLFILKNLLLSFFWLCEEAKYIYLCFHLGQKSHLSFSCPLSAFIYLVQGYFCFVVVVIYDYWV